jgi:hypothetical protein
MSIALGHSLTALMFRKQETVELLSRALGHSLTALVFRKQETVE